MKLTIKVIHPITPKRAKREEKIDVEVSEMTTLADMRRLLELEQWLNSNTKSRFHLEVEQ